ncbi:hypothetical protein WMY93_029942 [Mugilogobius chulae]|uniref:L1 transposable element RRM domain-containing protein n=1 Tax=Mugilogobius chulae TaxID=88201 RepID=A0AAW0MYD6_9GOBI
MTSTVEDVEEIKKSLNFITEETTAIKNQQQQLLRLMEEVKQLRLQNAEKDKKIAELERRVEDLEQYSRINDVVVTGLKIKPRSYAKAVAANNGGEPEEADMLSVEQQVAAFLESKGISLDLDYIEACHPLPRRKENDPPAVIMRFTNRKNKIALLKQGRKLKGTNVFLNDHLTRRNADLARKARYLRKLNKIQNTWVNNCKVFIKLNGPPEQARVLVIRSLEELTSARYRACATTTTTSEDLSSNSSSTTTTSGLGSSSQTLDPSAVQQRVYSQRMMNHRRKKEESLIVKHTEILITDDS